MEIRPVETEEKKHKKALPVVGANVVPADAEMEAELRKWEEAERERLGIQARRKQWVDTMTKSEMKKKEREETTILMGGLTAAQDFLIEGALKGLGYKTKHLDVPDTAALNVGKEFGNRGQCNPTYFTVGNLVKYLADQRDKHGISAEEVMKKNVFVTAGACGPCRFGMYVTEYRKALRDAGFDGFRVMLFQQQGGLKQATGDDLGLEFNPPFFIAIVKAIVTGDVLNAVAYRIRPYEVRPGATNEALEQAKRDIYKALLERKSVLAALWRAKRLFRNVEVDRLRAKPKASIIGEFWAMTTEGDGNYHLQKFLEQEGAENDIQLVTAWLLYTIWEVERDTRLRATLRGADGGRKGLESLGTFGVAKRLVMLKFAEKLLRVIFQTFAKTGGLYGYKLPDMYKIAEVAAPYYSNDLRGGEGHMEVGKLILNTVNSKAHITVSVKPFGCMPSSGVSDGVQSLVQNRFPGSIYCAVETSGDGATNFYSRVQMFLFKARLAAEEELKAAYARAGVTEQQVRDVLARKKRMANPLYHPHHHVCGTAANLVFDVAPYITQSLPERAARATGAALVTTAKLAWAIPVGLARGVVRMFAKETRQKIAADAQILAEVAGQKLRGEQPAA